MKKEYLLLKLIKKPHLSLTLEQGSIISSLAAIRALQPLTTLLRYTKGVLPINWGFKWKNIILLILEYNINFKTWVFKLKYLERRYHTSVTSFAIAGLASPIDQIDCNSKRQTLDHIQCCPFSPLKLGNFWCTTILFSIIYLYSLEVN